MDDTRPKEYLIQAIYDINTISNDVMSNQNEMSGTEVRNKLIDCVRRITVCTSEHDHLIAELKSSGPESA